MKAGDLGGGVGNRTALWGTRRWENMTQGMKARAGNEEREKEHE